jgi:NADH dehydrogenase/NADH:ubiquinone oxidoreductase subunit G
VNLLSINERYIFIDMKKNLTRPLTVIQICDSIFIDLPRFCYHEFLSIAGNCRMCLIELSDNKKLVVGCAVIPLKDTKLFITTNRVKRAREAILEFLLINHPLDCPICDQGGECDLQDVTMIFGGDRGRYYGHKKRAVDDKDIGILVKTVMTRCIHCTRCIRFFLEVSTNCVLGITGRGNSMEIGTYIKSNIYDLLSGNIVDLCPVGALTSKPYAFRGRSWETKDILSLDIMDGLLSFLRFEVFNNKILRVMSATDKVMNHE